MNPIPLGLALAAALAVPTSQATDRFLSPPAESALRAAIDSDARTAPGKAGNKAMPDAAAVGDADSFGREVRWLGLLAGSVFLQPNCSPSDGGCVALAPGGAVTRFDVPDVAVVTLPGGSSHSLLCQSQTPVVGAAFANPTTARARYELEAFPVYQIRSRVLRGLSHPTSGQPYNGVIELPIAAVLTEGYLEPGDYKVDSHTGARNCIGGLVSRRSLVENYGLSDREAERFFAETIQVSMGIRGRARYVDTANLYFGTRLTGD